MVQSGQGVDLILCRGNKDRVNFLIVVTQVKSNIIDGSSITGTLGFRIGKNMEVRNRCIRISKLLGGGFDYYCKC